MALDGKKSVREFECSDVLWRTFERMCEEQEKDIDELISDAMVAYAQLSGYQTGITEAEVTPPPVTPAAEPEPEPARVRPVPAPPPVPTRFGRPGPGAGGASGVGLPPPTPAAPARVSATREGSGGAASAPLYLVFDSQKYRIDKDQFIIGRGVKSSDLPIKDGNISRKHAAVIRRNGTYFIKDLGSTNGIDYKGMRIDNKRIDEGDIFHLCDYELRFTYKR
jgi:hypothetical protein